MPSRILALIVASLTLLVVGAAGAGAGAAARVPAPAEAAPVRDVVLAAPPGGTARKMARTSSARYPVGDGQGRTVRITITTVCEASCTAADPQEIAGFLGSLAHRGEISSLEVLVADNTIGSPGTTEFEQICGDNTLACYITSEGRMVIPGNDFVASDGANRAFVIAHEYGHHIANHRRNPPFEPAIYHGTKRWGTHERVCQGTRAGRYFPGNQGTHYYDNPGEAFAEAYAFSHFPEGMVEWNWDESLRPDQGAFAAIRSDVLSPWLRRARITRRGRVGARRRSVTRRIATPLDGDLNLRLRGAPGSQLDLVVRSARGRVLARSNMWGANDELRMEVCGQRRLRVTIRRPGRSTGGAFRLVALRP